MKLMVKCHGNKNIYKISGNYDIFNKLSYFYILADETSHKTEKSSYNSINFIVFSRSHMLLFLLQYCDWKQTAHANKQTTDASKKTVMCADDKQKLLLQERFADFLFAAKWLQSCLHVQI